MFDSRPILWLQQFATEGLTNAAVIVNLLGYDDVQFFIVIIVTFGISFRKGFALGQILSWNSLATGVLKTVAALPRPADVDASLELLRHSLFDSLARYLPIDVVGFYTRQATHTYGFPSGHVSSAVALWGGAWMLFRRRALLGIAIAMAIAAALIRMYLGRHFLADVIGGAIVGVAIVILAARLRDLELVKHASVAIVSPLAALALPGADVETVMRLVGLSFAFVFVAWRGLPTDRASIPHRLARIVVASATCLATWYIAGRVGASAALRSFLTPAIGLPTAAMIASRAGLFRRG